jgi:hypothetical protein
MNLLAFVLIGGGISVFVNMQGDTQYQMIGVVMVGVGFLIFKNNEDKN